MLIRTVLTPEAVAGAAAQVGGRGRVAGWVARVPVQQSGRREGDVVDRTGPVHRPGPGGRRARVPRRVDCRDRDGVRPVREAGVAVPGGAGAGGATVESAPERHGRLGVGEGERGRRRGDGTAGAARDRGSGRRRVVHGDGLAGVLAAGRSGGVDRVRADRRACRQQAPRPPRRRLRELRSGVATPPTVPASTVPLVALSSRKVRDSPSRKLATLPVSVAVARVNVGVSVTVGDPTVTLTWALSVPRQEPTAGVTRAPPRPRRCGGVRARGAGRPAPRRCRRR